MHVNFDPDLDMRECREGVCTTILSVLPLTRESAFVFVGGLGCLYNVFPYVPPSPLSL